MNITPTSQIIKRKIPAEILFNLLEQICVRQNNYYILNLNAYKKGIFDGTIQTFIRDCIPFYHSSKLKYLNRELCYNGFVTVIRQICKYLNINYTSDIKYDRSTYDIIYKIYLVK